MKLIRRKSMESKQKFSQKRDLKDLSKNEDGMILIISIALLAILAMIGTIAVKTTTTDIKISTNLQQSTEMFFAAEAGLEEARARLRGSSTAVNYIGDTTIPPNGSWSTYIRTDPSWTAASDDPNYDATLTNSVNASLQTDLSYWVKVRHKTEIDIDTDFETYTDNGVTTNDIIYYGYSTVSATNLHDFTVNTTNFSYNSAIMSPIEIVTSYGTGSPTSNSLEIQVRRGINPPIAAALYGNSVDLSGNVDVDGNDNCSGNAVPAVGYVTSLTESGSGNSITLESDAGESVQLAEAIDVTSIVDSLQDLATVVWTADVSNYIGDPSAYEIIYVDATNLTLSTFNFSTKPTSYKGYGTLVVRGNLDFGGGSDWYGLIIVSGEIKLHGGGVIHGAVMSGTTATANGTPDIVYDSCEIINASGGYTYALSAWKNEALD